MNMKKRYLAILALFIFIGLAQAAGAGDTSNPLGVPMPNPMDMATDVDENLKASGIYKSIISLASVIAISGFFVKIYAAVGKNSMQEMRGVLVQAVGVAMGLSMSAGIHSALTSTWNDTYNTSNTVFAGKLATKVAEAKGHMIEMAGTVATVTTLGSAGAAAGAVVKAAAKKEAVAVAGAEAAGSVAGKAASRITSATVVMSGFMVMYSTVIAIAAFIIIILGYTIPLAISLTMWGQTGPIWLAVGSSLGAILITAMMPMLGYSAIDRAFVKPAEASSQFMANSGIGEALERNNKQLREAYLKAMEGQMAACQAAPQDNSTTTPTQCSTDTKGMLQKAYDIVKAALSNASGMFENAVLQVINTIGQSIMQVIFAVLYFIAALVIMGALVNFIVGVLGGAASYVGAVAKGGG